MADDHAGLRAALREVLAEAAYQRCYVHFLRNALDYVPRKVDDDCLQELRWFYDRRDLAEARRDIAQWLAKWQAKYPRLCNWVEDNIEETLTYYRLPLPHHKHMKSTDEIDKSFQRDLLSCGGTGDHAAKSRGSRTQARPRCLQSRSSFVAPVRCFALPRRCHWLTKRS